MSIRPLTPRAATVLIGPGEIVFTRTPLPPRSFAKYRTDDSSAAFAKLQTEFTWLTGHGHAKDQSTELAAARAAFGPIKDVEATARPGKRATHEETGGHGDDAGDGGDGLPKDIKLSERERTHYASQVGHELRYPDWKAVAEELKHANPTLRKRMGAKAA